VRPPCGKGTPRRGMVLGDGVLRRKSRWGAASGQLRTAASRRWFRPAAPVAMMSPMDPSLGAVSATWRWGRVRMPRACDRTWVVDHRGSPMGPFYANFGPASGPSRYRDTPPVTGVLETPDNPKPIGTATEAGWTADGA